MSVCQERELAHIESLTSSQYCVQYAALALPLDIQPIEPRKSDMGSVDAENHEGSCLCGTGSDTFTGTPVSSVSLS